MENGMGGIDAARMERALEQIKETYEFQNEPDATLYFTDAYLPEGGIALN
jgi:NitT/TauT family transport system substrate-binding protein